MLQSEFFLKTKREPPKDEPSTNAQFLVRGGYVDKLAAGVFTFLPLGLRVLDRIGRIIREEMNAIGGQEMLMPALQPKELWEETGRWTSVDDLYKIKDRQERMHALGPTHEEVITDIVRRNTLSYKDLPFYLYQIQTKFRDELRPKSGLLRGREFLMKDLYSFHASEEDRKKYYEKAKKAYVKILSRCGLSPIVAEASGGSFSKDISHEFQVKTSGGEDIVVCCTRCDWAKNVEIAQKKAGDSCPNCGNVLKEEKSIEVGNIFTLGTKFSSAMKAFFTDKDGVQKPIVMGCYGIGLGRLMGAIAEVHHDERGLVWPHEVAPFAVHLISLPAKESKVHKRVAQEAERVYHTLQGTVDVLWDDREVSAGEKFADADLVGATRRVVISEKTLDAGKVEVKRRESNKIRFVSTRSILKT